MAFKELGGSGGNVLKWQTVGQVIEGRLIGTKRGKVFNGRPSTLAIIAQSNGVQVTIPLTSVLENRFIENEIKPGTTVRVTYLGQVTGKGGSTYKDFKLEADDSTVGQPLPAIQQQAPAQQPAQPAVQQPAVAAPPAQPAQPAQPAVPATEYDGLAAKLMEKVGAAAAAPMLNALAQLYPDAAVRTEQLKAALRTQGVAV